MPHSATCNHAPMLQPYASRRYLYALEWYRMVSLLCVRGASSSRQSRYSTSHESRPTFLRTVTLYSAPV